MKIQQSRMIVAMIFIFLSIAARIQAEHEIASDAVREPEMIPKEESNISEEDSKASDEMESYVKYDEGMELYRRKNYGEALKCFKAIIASNPKNAHATFYIGKCYEEFGDSDLSKEYYAKAAELEPNHSLFNHYASKPISDRQNWPKRRPRWQRKTIAWTFLASEIAVTGVLVDWSIHPTQLGMGNGDSQEQYFVEFAALSAALDVESIYLLGKSFHEHAIYEQEKKNESLIQVETRFANLDLIRVQCNPIGAKVRVELATVHF
jgi:tetratricopeptide (TPR) repeat protein